MKKLVGVDGGTVMTKELLIHQLRSTKSRGRKGSGFAFLNFRTRSKGKLA